MSDMLFEWDDSYLTGIEELDHEHKKLIGDINRLHDELIQQSHLGQTIPPALKYSCIAGQGARTAGNVSDRGHF